MTRMLMIAALMSASMTSAGWVDFGLEGEICASVRLLEADQGGMLLEAVVPGVELTEAASGGSGFTAIGGPGLSPSAPAPGWPMLPKLGFLAAVPADGCISISVESVEPVNLGIVLPYPMQPILPDTCRSAGAFAFSPDAYSSGLHPAERAGCIVDGVLRGVAIGRFAIVPFEWDAETGQLTAYRRMIVRVDFDGAVSTDPRLRSPWFDSIYSQTLINASVLGQAPASRCEGSAGVFYAGTPEEAARADGADLLVMAGSDFVSTMITEFATMKHNQGFMTSVVNAGGWTTAQIKDYIQNAYDTWNPAPSFVLFVGDHPQLPGYSFNGMNSDNRYVCVDGSDYMGDIFRGRFPTPTSHYQFVNDKILKWEFDPLTTPSFWNSVLCAGYFQDDDNNGIADRWFLFTCETVRDTYLSIFGKSVAREYCTNSTHSLPWYYRPDLPSAGQQVPSDITWDGDAAGITAAINSGVFLVQHRDHGMVNGWADPYYTTSHLSSLSNGDKTPVVFSVNCLTGQFSSDCFSENLFRMQGGAVAVYAAVEVSYSYFNDYLCYGMYHSFNDDFVSPPFVYTNPSGNYLAGQVLMGGHLEMQAAAPFNPYGSWEAYAEDEWDLFHVFGDPTMDMRTAVTQAMTVSAPPTLPVGSTSAQFTVTSGGTALQGALVCLRKPDQGIYATGITGSAGNVTLSFPALASATPMPWMVTAHNTIPVEGEINGVGVGEQGSAPALDAVGKPWPNPSSGRVSFPVTLSSGGDVRLEIFDLSGRLAYDTIETCMPSGGGALDWSGALNHPAGVYFARLTTPDGRSAVRSVVLAR